MPIFRVSPELRQASLQSCPSFFFSEKMPDAVDAHDLEEFFKAFSLQTLTSEQLHLCTEILGALARTIDPNFKIVKEQKRFSSAEKAKLTLIAMAAVLIAAFEGFDNVVTLLSVFPIAATALLATGILFSCVSIFIVCSSEWLNLKKQTSAEENLLQSIQEQLAYIKVIRKSLSEDKKRLCDQIAMRHLKKTVIAEELEPIEKNLRALQENVALLTILEQHLKNMMVLSQKYQLPHEIHPLLKGALTAGTSILFFSSGFCAGQMVGQFCLSFFYASIAANALPVVLIGALVGLVALSLTYSARFPDLKKIILGWSGIERKSLHQTRKIATKEITKLQTLKDNYQSFFKEDLVDSLPSKNLTPSC